MLPSNEIRSDAVASRSRLSPHFVLLAIVSLFAAGLLIYSQTMSFVWDEGFHLLSAQLIDSGKTPYIDYCFPQTPLNAYWNAFWLKLFAQSWRITHVVAALEVAGSIYLMADWVLRRFPDASWRLPCMLATAFLMACNTTVVQFGTVAQAYGIAMMLSAAAFRVTVHSAVRPSLLVAFFAGLVASASAGCTLLSAPIVPVLLVWLWHYSLNGSRFGKAAAFVLGCIPPFVPVIVLFIKAPDQTLFNVIRYQALFRRVNWPGATAHDFDVFTAWLDSTPALLLLCFGIAAMLFLRKADWDRFAKAEFYLCAWLAAAVILYISTAHPTFQRYMIVAVPFCAGLASAGFYALGKRLAGAEGPLWPTVVVCGLMALSITRGLFDDRDSTRWSQYEQIASKIREVTPANGLIYADEQVYFLLHIPPPFAMEFSYSHKLELPKTQEALYHIISEKELAAQVKQGHYATVESCKDDRIDELNLTKLFPNQKDIEDCSIFWGPMKASPDK